MSKVGVIMPLYNQNRRELTMALMSLATQIYMDWKLVIVIDGATDQTVPDTL